MSSSKHYRTNRKRMSGRQPANAPLSELKVIESLETRTLLSATVISQIPGQALSAGAAGTAITLGTYLNDPSLTGGTVVEMQTPLGKIPLQLTDLRTPLTVANFVKYINDGEYTPTIIQRSAPGFVLQGGGTKPDGSNNPPEGTLLGEGGFSNTTGTIAMALSNGPNSGTNQWFINLGDNSSLLDGSQDGGPFTVFGDVIDSGMTVANAIANLPIIDGSAENSNWYLGQNDGLPVINYTGAFAPTTVPQANLVTDNVVQIPSAQTVKFTAVSANPSLVVANVSGGVLTISSPAGATAGSTTVTATVTDLSGLTASSTFSVTVLPTVSVANAAATAGAGSQVVFPVTLSAPAASATTISYSLAAGTAPSGDFMATGSSVTISAGATTANIPVTVAGDTTAASETFTITLSGLSTNATFTGGGTTLTATGTINPPIVVAPGQTTTALSASSVAPAFGASDVLTAAITPATTGAVVTGTVNFLINGSSVGAASVSSNVATLTINLNTAGTLSITAVYSGDTADATSSSDAISVTVAAPSVLAPAITATKLPATAIAGQPFKGNITLPLNNTNLVQSQTGKVIVNLYLTSGGELTPGSPVLATLTRALTIKPGKTAALKVPIIALPPGLAPGTYTITAQAVDASGLATVPVNGPILTVAAATVSFSETFAKLSLPAAVIAGAKTPTAALLKITNNGNVALNGATTISLYASPDGAAADGILLRTITPKLIIKPGKTDKVTIPLGSYPATANGNYFIVAQVTDPETEVTSIVSAAPVNIAAAHVDLAASALTVPPTAVSSVTLSFTISNSGNTTAAGLVQIAVATSTAADGSNPADLESVPASIKIPAGRSQKLHLKVRIPQGLPTGSLYLLTALDFSAIPALNGSATTTLVSAAPTDFK